MDGLEAGIPFERNADEALSALKRGETFRQLRRYGWDDARIAQHAGITSRQVQNLCRLAAAPSEIHDMVSAGIVSATLAIDTLAAHGVPYAIEILKAAKTTAPTKGAKAGKVTAQAVAKITGKPPKNAAKAMPAPVAMCAEASVAGGDAGHGLAHSVVAQFSLGVLVFDRQLRLMLCNERARNLLGIDADAEGGTLHDALPELALAECCQALSRGEEEVAARIRLPDGRVLRWRTRRLGTERWLATLDEARRGVEAEADGPALLDPLTGLETRRGFIEHLPGAMISGAALVMLDLDRFKLVNDSLGHPAGDALLRLVGQRIASAVRAEDAAFRLGGDEFAVVLRDGAGAHAFAERLVDLLSRPYLVQGHVATVGASAGVAYAPGDGADADALVHCADMALYAAKADGRGVVRPFRPEMARRAAARHALEQDLRAAIPRGQLELFYQAQANLATRSLVGFEALLRWRHPERGLVSPADFIPLAEETRLITQIGEWALRTACLDAQGWPAPLPVAVNVSAVQLAEPGRLCRAVEIALASSRLDPARLELEITESALVRDPDAALRALRALRGMGVHIAMDDFGTGYSSLSQLRSFPFDKLKIDRSFVRDLGDSAEAVAVVRAIAALGTSLGMRTTAEGVETGEQADRVLAEGCTDMQGYLLSRPLPAGNIAALITQLKEGF